jgi:hypothetical protein
VRPGAVHTNVASGFGIDASRQQIAAREHRAGDLREHELGARPSFDAQLAVHQLDVRASRL